MKIETIVGKRVDDTYYRIKHPSGLTVFVYPKEKANVSYAVFGTKYGSVDTCFRRSDESETCLVPEGIAHYLEHKLFESETEDAFTRFAGTGASANAFTSFESTCYIFSCTDRFYDSLEILLDFVQSPYFTKETVEKEQGIIGQEIMMYQDDPQWRVMFNYLRTMYHKHPVRLDIAGTVESIAKITPELLYRCYNTFYNLNNMVLSVAGNVNVERVLEICDKMLRESPDVTVERVFDEEPSGVLGNYIEEKLSVSMPLFQFGYKAPAAFASKTEREIAALEVALEILASDSSTLFSKLLDDGLINESSFGMEYFEGYGYSTPMFSGESKNPEAVVRAINEEVKRISQEGIAAEDFHRAKKSLYGENVVSLNSSSNLANAMTSMFMKGRELFKYLDALADITTEEVQKVFTDVLKEENSVLSVIYPL